MNKYIYYILIIIAIVGLVGITSALSNNGKADLTGQAVETLCVDTDNGIDLETYGTTTGYYGTAGILTKSDYCIPGGVYAGQIVEYHCVGDWMQYHRYDCPIDSECIDGECVSEPNLISVAAIKLDRDDYSLVNLNAKLISLITNHPEVDLIVTPEFIFFDDQDYKENPVIVDCQVSPCLLSHIGTPISVGLKNKIENIQSFAAQYEVNILLGTVADLGIVNGYEVSFNTMLIIDTNGDIIGKQRKDSSGDAYVHGIDECSNVVDLCDEISLQALQTIESRELSTNDGTLFTIAPVICGDLDNQDAIDMLENSNVDIITLSSVHSANYGTVVDQILAGQDPFENPSFLSVEWTVKNTLIDEYQSRGISKFDSYLVVANGGQGGGMSGLSAEIIPLNYDENYEAGYDILNDLAEIYDLDRTNDYSFGVIEIY
jgi:predicted amidohydrolase